ncbi:MAG: ATP-binding cassette domain-containing protein [Geminicoccaceae bacterium]|nr:ATP-binding cassette domain-containing protein [Geminicoccaceae bacterium]MCB9943543.1 ATP-binding cassette domain-containing protein [Geminicoccaceae bacterium]
MNHFLRIDGISARAVPDAHVVRDTSLRLLEGGIGALLGGSHAGKSQLLRLIVGAEAVVRGRIALGNSDLTLSPPDERLALGISCACQHPPLFPDLSASEHIALGMGGRKIDTDRRHYLLQRLPELEDIWPLRMATLARRARRAVDLARAIVNRPKLVLIDELSLDLGVERMIEIVRALHRDGSTLLVAERYPDPLLSISDQVWVMSHGRIILRGHPVDVAQDDRLQAACIGDLPPPI